MKRLTIYATIFIISLLIFAHYVGWLKPLEKNISAIFEPVQSFSWRIFKHRQPLSQTETIWLSQLKKLAVDYQRLAYLEQENKELREALNFKNKQTSPIITAHVIGKDQRDQQAYILDRGQADGVKEQMPVIVNDGVLWALVISVKESTSIALPITDPRVQFTARLTDSTIPPTLITGDHAISLKMDYVPQDFPVDKNQLIITAGLEPLIPMGLTVGQVQGVTKSPEALWQKVSVSSFAAYNEPTIVSLILPAP